MRSAGFIFIFFLCLFTALALIWVRHENREQIVALQSIYQERDVLNIEWQRLLIERAAHSRYDQLENWALSNEFMAKPNEQMIVYLERSSIPKPAEGVAP